MQHWLLFFSTLVWQVIVLSVLLVFRSELSNLLTRVARLKHGDTEVEFQELSLQAPEAIEISAEIRALRDEFGFFTLEGLRDLVGSSEYLQAGERVVDAILCFTTKKQRSWLVSTNSQVFFILDDERTRATQRLIQRRTSLDEALPVETRPRSEKSGAFRLGASDWWYYSIELLGDPPPAGRRLDSFVRTAKGE